jgi:phosphoglycerate kinase
MENFKKGSEEIANTLVSLEDATTIIGGGDSAAMAINMGLEPKLTHISTGGGASMEFLEGKELPGISSIEDIN